MPTVMVRQARAGMVLAAPIEDALGRVLINAGEELTDELILVLIKRGFGEIEIRPPQLAATPVPSSSAHPDYETELARLMASFKRRFERAATAEDKVLMRVALKVLVERLNARMRG